MILYLFKDRKMAATDRRKNMRLSRRILVTIDNQPGLLLDISRTGIRVSTAMAPERRRVDIRLQADNRFFNLKGYINWINRKYSVQNLKEMGISIEGAEPDYYRFLDKLFPESS
jgi:hypothetical protein